MLYLKGLFSIILYSLIWFSITAQEGAPLLSHYKENRELENQSWAICQDENDVMLFANRRGILTFDGQNWNYIRIPTIPYSIIYNTHDRKVYIGGDNNYGYLQKDEWGFYKYISLSGDSAGVGIISRILFTDSTVCFYGEQSISRHSLQNHLLNLRLRQKDNNPFSGMFLTPKNTFVNIMNRGLYRVESDTLFPIVSGYLLEKEEILFCLPYDNSLVLLGLGNGKLSLFDGIKFYDYQIKDDGYLRQNILSEGLSISDSLYAFSTLDGGALIINKKSGAIRFAVNYQNGLPDDEIFAIGLDKSNGLWLSHQYGLTRADIRLPVGNFSIYPGLKGNLITSLKYDNELYVATSEGVFYLTEIKNYAEVEVVQKKEPGLMEETKVTGQDKSVEKVEETQKPRRSIFSRIFGKRTTSTAANEKFPAQTEKPTGIEKAATKNLSMQPFLTKTVSRLKSINYIYKKVEGLNEKCKQLVATDHGILAATNKGLFNIFDHKARSVVSDRYINFISERSKDEKYYIAANDGYFYVRFINSAWSAGYTDKNFVQTVYSIVSTDENTIWAGGDNIAFRIVLNMGSPAVNYYSYTVRNDFPQRYITESVNDTTFLFTESDIYFFDTGLNEFKEYKPEKKITGAKLKYIFSQANVPWINLGDDWIYLSSGGKIEKNDKALLKIFDEIISIVTDDRNIWVIDENNQLFRIARNKMTSIKPDLNLFIKSISNEKGKNFNLSDIVFERGDNTVYFEIVAPGYLKQSSTEYQYTVDKIMEDWSKWSTSSMISLMMRPGVYTLRVRARDIWGNIGEPKSLKFTIKAPFTKTTFFYTLMLVLGLIIIIVIIKFRERQLRNDKKILEKKVRERTAEIEAQKEEITSSIEYASRIQMAMLPETEHLGSAFSDYFVLFRPRDIVSGDFYWIGEDENHIFFTVADCTGHGVPGAFMSTMGISTLNEILTNKKDLKANTVLNLLREKIKIILHQTGKEGEAADGMDIAFCILHKNRKTLEYAGAYNPLFIFQDGVLKEYKADRMPIGIYLEERESFINYEINIKKGDTLYIFSDGFTDQFGGPENVKFKKANLKKLFSEIYLRPMEEQRQILEAEFEKWKGKADQVDDVTIMGVRI
jgi:serine phosphatase RsbU (regulator of sigma subunit)